MPTQYDPIAEQYDRAKSLPAARLETWNVERCLGEVTGRSVLDLACGGGHYVRRFVAAGARRVLGVDASADMIGVASKLTAADPQRVEYLVGDCRRAPEFGRFDLVTGVWLLNHAADERELELMFRCAHANLVAGGAFFAVTQSPWFDPDGPGNGAYGFDLRHVGPAAEGTTAQRIRVRALTEPPIEFEAFVADEHRYARAARAAGFGELRWELPSAPPEQRTYWADYLSNPAMAFCRAVRER